MLVRIKAFLAGFVCHGSNLVALHIRHLTLRPDGHTLLRPERPAQEQQTQYDSDSFHIPKDKQKKDEK